MRCTACGAELIAGKQFCHACGARVAPRCAGCGATLEATFRFCPDCGLRVGDAVHDTAPPASDDPLARLARWMPAALAERIRASRGLEGERKQVTVLFCDLAGSTAIAERLDPEEYHELLDEYLELAFREIYRLDGIVNQLAGDGIMALFGAPVAHEDAPQRAVGAALAIQDALGGLAARLRAERGIELRARIGIHTGPVVVGRVGNDLKMDYSAIGDTTNLAARLEALAPPGTVLISEATHRLVRGLFAVEPAGPLAVKGKRERVVAYRVLARAEAATSMTIAEERGLTPFVGRPEELALVEGAFRRLGTQAQVVAVVGDAGCGKSRLVYEFKRRLAGEPAVFFEARCSAMNQAAPFHPFVSMLRAYFGLRPGDPPDAARAKVAARLGKCDDELERRFPLLGRFMADVPRDGRAEALPDELQRESFEAVTGLLLREAERVPVVLLIEDVQWIDEPSRELLARLVAGLDRARVLVLLTHRPHDHAAWQTTAAFTQIVLRPLADADVATIIRAIAGGALPHELEARLVAKADGSPFFAEEMTHGLREEGYLLCGSGACRVTRPVEEIPVPGTIQEVIAARLDRLTPAAKRVIQVAAVLGRQFDGESLARVLDGEGIDVPRELADLERRGLLHRKHLLSNGEYRFGESLTQEVAYEGLLLRQRRQLHERAGMVLEAAIEGEPSAERAAVLAHHFSRSDNRAKALEALVRAGRAAFDLPSYETAADFFRRALELSEAGLPDDGDESRRRLVLEAINRLCALTVVFGLPYFAEATRAAGRGRALAEELNDLESLSSLTYHHGVLVMMGDRGEFARGLALVEEALAIAQRAGLFLQSIRLARGLCVIYVHDARFALAERTIDWCIAEIEARGDAGSDLHVSARWVRELVLVANDDLDRGLASARETHAMAERAPNQTIRGAAAGTIATIHFLRGEYAEAKEWADRAYEVSEHIANLAALGPAAAIALASRRELGEPVDVVRYVAAIDRCTRVPSATTVNLRIVGEALLAVGDLERAQRWAEQLQRQVGGRLRRAQIATLLAEVMMRLGRTDEAARWLDEAWGLAEALEARSTLADVALVAAELAALRGDDETRLRCLARAEPLCAELRLGRCAARAARLAAARPSATAAGA
ncbi:MAG TPA: adenylate/guanylate cyclase domain-containing protein [Candidatus Binatia bacterium]|nr:adenylate/guanylate cyclase domain-containing protein [Candidatus Binatia bacterium]